MYYLNLLIFCLSLLVFIFLACQAVYLFIFSMIGRFGRARLHPKSMQLGSFVIYIPSYKEDQVIIDTAMAAMVIDYPADKKKIVVIADSLKTETLRQLRLLPIQVVEVSFEKSTKAKALNVALQQTDGDYDYALVLDADNVCDKDFLYKMNDAFKSGCQVVQGQRVAKNADTDFALLDAISEGINNHLFRQGHVRAGLSCALIGSGMAFNYPLFKQIMPEVTAVGGFDKEIELRLLSKRIHFGYAEKAIVYDEKTPHQSTFENQRRRWMSAQLHYMQRYAGKAFLELLKGNFDFVDKVVQTMLLPRILLLGIVPVVFLLSLIPGAALHPVYWFVLWMVTYGSILFAIPFKFFNRQLIKALFSLPVAFFAMFKLLFRLKGANKTFIHTPHGEIKPKEMESISNNGLLL